MISVKKNPEKPESKEILAEAIVRIGEAADALGRSGFNQSAIVTLLHAKTKIPQRDILLVLDGLKQLRGWYCR